jgi:hypothetical protein
MIEIDPKNVFIIPKFWGGMLSAALSALIGLISYIYVINDRSYREEMTRINSEILNIKIELKDIEIRHLATIDVLQELHSDEDIINRIQRQQMKYYRAQVRSENK